MVFASKFPPRHIPDDAIVHNFVLKGLHRFGNRVAILDNSSNESITYIELVKYVQNVARNLLINRKLAKGDVVGLLLPNHIMYPVLFLGISTAGGTVTTMNPLYSTSELNKQLNDSEAKYLVTSSVDYEKAMQAVRNTLVKTVFVIGDTIEADRNGIQTVRFSSLLQETTFSEDPLLKVKINSKEDVVVLPYSSGTTGVAKGVMLTHHNLVANLIQFGSIEKRTPDVVVAGVLPFFHIYGMVIIQLKSIWEGATIISFHKYDLIELLSAIQKHKISNLNLVPPILLSLVNDPVVEKYDLSSLKSIQCGGAALPDELAKKANIKFRIPIAQGYGLTETSPSTNSSPFNDIKIGSTGVLCCNTELKILDVQTGRELGYNEEGELCFRGPQIMKGYLSNPSATKEIIKDGWLHSGDIGYIDTDGHIFITDRLKELIKYKGNQVPPAYLEDIIFKQIGVEDCAVIGVPDTEAGELPKAFVVLKQGAKLTEQDVMKHVSAVVSPHKRVRLVEFIDAIPRSASGKILRRTLREREKQRLMKSKL